MIDKEKLRELCNRFMDAAIDDEDKVITEWLEQNQPTPQVVGLSDEQICELADYISDANYEHHFKSKSEVITEFLKTQTFSQPAVGNSDTSSNWDDAWIQELSTELAGFAYSKENIKSLITAFLDKKPNFSKVKVMHNPIVVGLSDEQVKLLSQDINNCFEDGFTSFTPNEIKLWLKTQTFADTYEDKYNDLYEDYQSLIVDKMLVDKELEQLKSQQDITDGGWRGKYDRLHIDYNLLLDDLKDYYSSQAIQMTYQKMYNELHDCFVDLQKELEQLKSQFQPNWEDAPKDATLCRINRVYENEHGFMLTSKKIFREERPKPTPQVEVGQVWRHASEKSRSGDDYEVTEVTTLEGKFKIGDEWQEDVVMITYENAAQDVYRRILSDFLAKFEKAQS